MSLVDVIIVVVAVVALLAMAGIILESRRGPPKQ
jgi:hypothetical protein